MSILHSPALGGRRLVVVGAGSHTGRLLAGADSAGEH